MHPPENSAPDKKYPPILMRGHFHGFVVFVVYEALEFFSQSFPSTNLDTQGVIFSREC